jgi:hypothetical protein
MDGRIADMQAERVVAVLALIARARRDIVERLVPVDCSQPLVLRIGKRIRSGSECRSCSAAPLRQIWPCENEFSASPRIERISSPACRISSPHIASHSVHDR